MRIEVTPSRDEWGEPEQLTWDLFPVVEASQTLHLDQNGVPKVGTEIRPGMILVGKIGKSKRFDPNRQPTALEIQGLSFRELHEKYGAMWQDASLYATDESSGLVLQAFVEETQCGKRAIVELDPSIPAPVRTEVATTASGGRPHTH